MSYERKYISFYLGYLLLFFSLFIGDINSNFGLLSQYVRYCSYLLFIIQIFSTSHLKKKDIQSALFWMLLSLAFFILTKDMYWTLIVLIIYETKHIDVKKLLKFHTHLMIVGFVVVLVLCLIGVLPDHLTAREGIEFVGTRHSLGFVHSDVPPLLLVYIMLYHLWRKRERYNRLFFCIFICSEIIMYIICDARNSFYTSIIIAILILISPLLKKPKIMKIYEKICFFVTPVLSAFSFAMMFLLVRGGIFDRIDSFFSGRFRLAIFKSREIGLHFVNLMSNADYFKDEIVMDNGYLYIIMRYGIVFLLFYFIVSYLLVKKAKQNPYMLCCIFAASLLNFIDNDLVDYSFLPFIIVAFSDMNLNLIRSKRICNEKSGCNYFVI